LAHEPKYTLPTIEERPDAIRLKVWLQPGASRERVVGLHGGALKVAVTAPPEKGKANEAARAFLARLFGVGASRVLLRSGASSREKCFEILGLPTREARSILQAILSKEEPPGSR